MKSAEQTHCMLNDIDVGKLFSSHIGVEINEIPRFMKM